jgi:hypothetical protein
VRGFEITRCLVDFWFVFVKSMYLELEDGNGVMRPFRDLVATLCMVREERIAGVPRVRNERCWKGRSVARQKALWNIPFDHRSCTANKTMSVQVAPLEPQSGGYHGKENHERRYLRKRDLERRHVGSDAS